jgi:hypothetical protein
MRGGCWPTRTKGGFVSYQHKHAVENTPWFDGRVTEKSGKVMKAVRVKTVTIKAVLRELANFANYGEDDTKLKDWAWPTRHTLGERCGLSVSTIRRVIRWLRFIKFFRFVQKVVDENKEQHATRYLFRPVIKVGGKPVMVNGQEELVGGIEMFKAHEGVEGGWMPDEKFRGAVAPYDDQPSGSQVEAIGQTDGDDQTGSSCGADKAQTGDKCPSAHGEPTPPASTVSLPGFTMNLP